MKLSKSTKLVSLLLVSTLLSMPLIIEQALKYYQNNTLSQEESIINDLKTLASSGDNSAAFLLATAYKNGKLGVVNFEKAFYWYKEAAQRGDKDSMLMLGWIYYKGSESISIDSKKAKHWFSKAANEGVDEAVEMLELLR